MKYFKLIQLVALVCLNSCSTYLYTLVVKKKKSQYQIGAGWSHKHKHRMGNESAVSYLSADSCKCTFPLWLINNGGHINS